MLMLATLLADPLDASLDGIGTGIAVIKYDVPTTTRATLGACVERAYDGQCLRDSRLRPHALIVAAGSALSHRGGYVRSRSGGSIA